MARSLTAWGQNVAELPSKDELFAMLLGHASEEPQQVLGVVQAPGS